MPSTNRDDDPAAVLDEFKDEIRDAVNTYLSANPAPSATEPAREVDKRAWVRTDPGLAPEMRNERQFVRVKLPMEVEHRGTTYRGFDISLGGFSLFGHPAIADDAVEDFVIRLLFRGYALTVKVRATPVRQVQDDNLTGFRILEIEEEQLGALRKILRAYLGGQLVTLEGLLVSADVQTAREARAAAVAEARLSGKALWRQRAWYGAIALATFALLMVLAASLFERLAVVDAAFAAVTAPKLEVRSPADGEVGAHRLRPGDRVARDHLLAEIRDRELEIELELVRARVAEGQKLLESPQSLSNSYPSAPPWPTPLQSTPAGPERRAELEATVALEQARLTALEHRLESNRLYASCACRVFWAAPAGDWVRKGDRLFTLVLAGPSDLLVEALVPLRAVARLRQHYTAFIELPHSGELIEARVALIALDSERQPRAGVPRWAQQDQSLASVLLSPSRALPSDMIGVPLNVVFSRVPEITQLAANLKTRLGDLAPTMLAAFGLSGSRDRSGPPVMTSRRHALISVCAAAVLVLPLAAAAQDLFTPEERRALDLERFVVVDPGAGYFDVAARRAWLQTTTDPVLRQTMDRLGIEVGCRDKLDLPVIDHELRLPRFYRDQEAWREAILPLFAFEDALSDLAGAFVATGDPYFADCLLDLLGKWATADALSEFYYTLAEPQAWFNIEDMLFAAGLAYAVVRDQAEERAADKQHIDGWLARIARNHLSIAGGPSSCCNNHFYRRALYATVIGILNADDDLFRVGVKALFSALHEMGPRGELPREIARGARAAHYQNYALVYLVPIAELIERQGYAAYGLRVDGRSLHDAVTFALDVLEDPAQLGDLAPPRQHLGFIEDDQYFAWMEIYLSRFADPRIERWLAPRRPVANRSAGGHLTLFFWDPDRRSSEAS